MAKKRSKAWRAAKARRNEYRREAESRRRLRVVVNNPEGPAKRIAEGLKSLWFGKA